MNRLPLLLVCVVLPTSFNHGAPALKERKDDDASRIVGRWVQEAISQRGSEPQPGRASVFRFGDDGACGLTLGVQGAKETAGKYALDPTKSPRRMKWLHGPALTEWLCLYQLEGDKLNVAFVDERTQPPQKIEPATNLTIYYLKRLQD
jgi:uncharacterized protein (TIGR03067 family)